MKDHALLEAEIPHHVLQALALVTPANDVKVNVERGIELGESLQDNLNVLLAGESTHEQRAVLGLRFEARDIVFRVQSAADRKDIVKRRVVFEKLGGAARRCGHRGCLTERAVRHPPAPLDERTPKKPGQRGVVEHVFGHHVVRANHPQASFCALDDDAATDDNVRLKVHHVGLECVEQFSCAGESHPGQDEAEPVVQRPAPARPAVHGHLLALNGFHEGSVTATTRGWGDDMHVVTALDEAGSQPLCETRCAIHIRGEGVAGNQHPKRGFRSGVFPCSCLAGHVERDPLITRSVGARTVPPRIPHSLKVGEAAWPPDHDFGLATRTGAGP